MSKLKLTGVALVAVAASATTTIAEASAPAFVHTPAVAYSGKTISVVVRLDRALAKVSTAGFVAAPALKAGEDVGDSYGGNGPGRIGTAGRHCYLAEAIQPRPRATPHADAKWRLGLIDDDERILRTHAVALQHISGSAGASWARDAAKKLGCYR